MSTKNLRGIGFLLILILIFGLAGGAIGEILGNNIKSLSFLKSYMTIGMTKPVLLDLKLISLTFGLNLNVNILSLAGMMLGFFIYKRL